MEISVSQMTKVMLRLSSSQS